MRAPLDVLLVDDDPDFRALVRHHLTRAAPDVTLWDYDPQALGLPPREFDWRRYDVLLLDYQLGEGAGAGGDGLSWLARLRLRPGFPPTVLITAQGDEYVAVRALKLGAEDYLRKQDVTAERLAQVVRDAAGGKPPRPLSAVADQTAAPPPDDRVLTGLNQYRLVRKIGAGTQSRIYLGQRVGDGREVAVKIIAVGGLIDDSMVRRFSREAAALSRIDSPHVVKLYEHAFSEDCGFLAMEYLRGGDLRARLLAPLPPLGPERACEYLRQILSGLATVHRAGVLHRDLKPTNIMLREESGESLVIADFGISRFAESSTEHTTEGMLLGTPAYMSPEQCMGRPVDERADLYSAGVVFYEMLVGRRPYTGRGVTDVLHKHVNAPVPRLPAALAHLQPLLDALMAKAQVLRVRSADDALERLAALTP